jgi:L-ascorbate metabolism protein UlaG (beta-lactamase superfamily)
MKITYLGHASLGIEANGKHLIVDPFISANPLASDINIDELAVDYILLTHAHQDHVLDVEAIVERTGATIICNAEMSYYYDAKGFKTVGMNTGGKIQVGEIQIKSTIAFHTSSFADGTYGGNPNGYILECCNKKLYIAGDTALTQEMKLIPETIGKLELAILPIGDHFTMGMEDACFAADFLQCNKVLGYHFDTFPPIKIDHEEAKNHFQSRGKELILLEIGKDISI